MISCKEYVEQRKLDLKEEVSKMSDVPKLCVVQIGDNPASNAYIKGKRKDCEELGIEFEHVHIKDYDIVSQNLLEARLKYLDSNKSINGIIIQLPIPNKYDINELQDCISPIKDVDGFCISSYYKPCTPKGIIDWLKYNGYDFVGKTAVVLGRSKIVGLPLTKMLIEEGATVTCCNSHTTSLSRFMFNADLIISAIGRPKFFNKFDFHENSIIVDVGINRDENGKLCGDVDTEQMDRYHPNTYITPVPGGVGLCTRLALLENTIDAFKKQNN